jgi:hypothetical protein
MAKRNKAPRAGGKRIGKSTALMFVCGGIAFVIAALPSVVILAVGMIPTIVAYIIDLTPGRYAARCVAGLNIAGVVPFLNRLWTSTNDMAAAIDIVTDVYAWLAFYAASGVGWLLFSSLPSIVASFKTYSARRHANALRGRLEELREEWGEEISGSSPEGLREGEDNSGIPETDAAPA